MPDLRKELLRQMQALRSRLDPKVVERVKYAMFGKVPYDRDNAQEAVHRFLASRDDDGEFQRKLEDALRKEGATLTEPAPEPPKDKPPTKWRRIGRII